jgi:prevent-host-death family protein
MGAESRAPARWTRRSRRQPPCHVPDVEREGEAPAAGFVQKAARTLQAGRDEGRERKRNVRRMRRIAVSAVRERIADVLGHVALRRERIVLTRHGRELGAIVPMEDLEVLRSLDERDQDQSLSAYRSSWRRVTDTIHRRH